MNHWVNARASYDYCYYDDDDDDDYYHYHYYSVTGLAQIHRNT